MLDQMIVVMVKAKQVFSHKHTQTQGFSIILNCEPTRVMGKPWSGKYVTVNIQSTYPGLCSSQSVFFSWSHFIFGDNLLPKACNMIANP